MAILGARPGAAAPCGAQRCAVFGAGPVGLRAAIELATLGARVTVRALSHAERDAGAKRASSRGHARARAPSLLASRSSVSSVSFQVLEKRASFTRPNILHLWEHTVADLQALGARSSTASARKATRSTSGTRQLQLLLLKVGLLLGVRVRVGVGFAAVEPCEGAERARGGGGGGGGGGGVLLASPFYDEREAARFVSQRAARRPRGPRAARNTLRGRDRRVRQGACRSRGSSASRRPSSARARRSLPATFAEAPSRGAAGPVCYAAVFSWARRHALGAKAPRAGGDGRRAPARRVLPRRVPALRRG